MAMWRHWRQRLLGWLGIRGKAGVAVVPLQAQAGMSMQDVGAGNLQVGQVSGPLRVVHLKQERNVTNNVVHHHIYTATPPTSQMRAPEPAAANDGARLTREQREVFTLMKQLTRREYNQVVTFMRREFDTGLVNQLNDQQLFRVRRYVQTIQRNEERERA